VLYLDPDPAARQRCIDHLGGDANAFTVTTVETVSDALDSLADDSVDCLVTEYDLPNTDGIEVVYRVRAANPTVPVVVFTGTAESGVGRRAVEAGAADYRRKTGRPEQYRLLARDVRRALDEREPSVAEDTSTDSEHSAEPPDSEHSAESMDSERNGEPPDSGCGSDTAGEGTAVGRDLRDTPAVVVRQRRGGETRQSESGTFVFS
jgi:CheY-like chemotaxis protein